MERWTTVESAGWSSSISERDEGGLELERSAEEEDEGEEWVWDSTEEREVEGDGLEEDGEEGRSSESKDPSCE